MTVFLAGHEKNREMLRRLTLGNPQGSYIFSGPEGVGKRTVSRWFSQLLNCSSSGNMPCGICSNCIKIEKENHPDIKIIHKADDKTVITIEQIREEILHGVDYAPFEGTHRVFIIDDAHYLNHQSQNALLKVMEEPPATTLIILVTSRMWELLPTIISRCRILKFFPMRAEEVENILRRIPEIPHEKIPLIVKTAGGSPGKGIRTAMNQDFWKWRNKLLDFMTSLPSCPLTDILHFCNNLPLTRSGAEEIETTFEIMAGWFRDILFHLENMEEENFINGDRAEGIESCAFSFSHESIMEIYDMIFEVRKLVFENNLNLKLGFQRLFIKIKQSGERM